MPLRRHHFLVATGLIAGIVVGSLIHTEPAYVGWLLSIGCGISGGAFLAAITSGDALAGGSPPPGTRGRRGASARPAWWDEPETASPTDARSGAPTDEPETPHSPR